MRLHANNFIAFYLSLQIFVASEKPFAAAPVAIKNLSNVNFALDYVCLFGAKATEAPIMKCT
jgi:hypothetical protein